MSLAGHHVFGPRGSGSSCWTARIGLLPHQSHFPEVLAAYPLTAMLSAKSAPSRPRTSATTIPWSPVGATATSRQGPSLHSISSRAVREAPPSAASDQQFAHGPSSAASMPRMRTQRPSKIRVSPSRTLMSCRGWPVITSFGRQPATSAKTPPIMTAQLLSFIPATSVMPTVSATGRDRRLVLGPGPDLGRSARNRTCSGDVRSGKRSFNRTQSHHAVLLGRF